MLHSNAFRTSAVASRKIENSVLVYLERKQIEESFVAPPQYNKKPQETVERLDMPRPDALAMALLEQYPDHASKTT